MPPTCFAQPSTVLCKRVCLPSEEGIILSQRVKAKAKISNETAAKTRGHSFCFVGGTNCFLNRKQLPRPENQKSKLTKTNTKGKQERNIKQEKQEEEAPTDKEHEKKQKKETSEKKNNPTHTRVFRPAFSGLGPWGPGAPRLGRSVPSASAVPGKKPKSGFGEGGPGRWAAGKPAGSGVFWVGFVGRPLALFHVA